MIKKEQKQPKKTTAALLPEQKAIVIVPLERTASPFALAAIPSTVAFDKMKGWDKLEVKEQDIVITETKSILGLRHTVKNEMGAHLLRVRSVLMPKKLYESYLKTLDISRSTAYRYTDYYEAMQKTLPAPVMEVIMKRDVTLNEKRIAAFPPPKTTNEAEINTWIDMQEKNTGKTIQVQQPNDNEDSLKKIAMHRLTYLFKRLPNNSKTKGIWVREVCGMLLGLAGITTPQTIDPIGIPENLKIVRGRPRKQA